MKQIQITLKNEIADYQIPEAWSEVTVAQYAGMFGIPQGLDALKRSAWTLQHFTGIPESQLWMMRMSYINELAAALEFVHTTAPTPDHQSIEAGGWKWRRRTAWDNITYGEVTSIQTIAGESMLRNLPKLVCILLERVDADDNAIPWDTEAMTAESDFAAMPITRVAGVIDSFPNGSNG